MSDQIVSRSMMFDRGVATFNAGRPRDSHGMNPWAPALADWLAGYDQAKEDFERITRPQAVVCLAEVSPP